MATEGPLQPKGSNICFAPGQYKAKTLVQQVSSVGENSSAEDVFVSLQDLPGQKPLTASAINSAADADSDGSGAAKSALEVESKHEVIALLQQPGGGSNLCMNWANWNQYKAAVDDGSPTLVVSFLGDTEVGKSHTIRELMNPLEERPFVQRGRDQNASTTFNVNLYSCRSLVRDAVVHLLDFEGENGSDTPILALARGTKGTVSKAGSSVFSLPSGALSSLAGVVSSASGAASGAMGAPVCARAEAVREHFPRLAYTTSDVIALVGTDPFFSTRYLERAVDFAKRANAGVCDVDLPVLLLISNRRDGDRCILDIKESTAQFMDAMGDSFRVLDQYFSALLCVYLPNKRSTTVGDDGALYDGEALYAMQMGKLRTVLAALMKARLTNRYGGADGGGNGSRLITCRQGLWFDLVPRIVRELNAGRPVHVTRLVDEAWSSAMAQVSSQSEAVGDILKALVAALRPHPALSTGAPNEGVDYLQRFSAFHALVLDLAVRVAAARLRHVDANLRFPARMRAYARMQLEAVLSLLDGVTPCKAVYGHGPHASVNGETGSPVDRPNEPVMCLQEQRVHAKGHRSGRRVRGGGKTLWQKVTNLVAYSPAWVGKFDPCVVARPDMESLLGDVVSLAEASGEDFMAALGTARSMHSSAITSIQLVPLQPSAASLAGPEDTGPEAEEGLIKLTNVRSGDSVTACLPYCIGCTRKVVSGMPEELQSVRKEHEADIAKQEKAWLTSTFQSVVAAVGLGSSSTPVKKLTEKASTSVRVASSCKVEGAEQQLSLGLCSGCWQACMATNESTRAKRTQQRLSMADVE